VALKVSLAARKLAIFAAVSAMRAASRAEFAFFVAVTRAALLAQALLHVRFQRRGRFGSLKGLLHKVRYPLWVAQQFRYKPQTGFVIEGVFHRIVLCLQLLAHLKGFRDFGGVIWAIVDGHRSAPLRT